MIKKRNSLMFTKRAADIVLKAFGKHFNSQGYIADIKTGELALIEDGEKLTRKTFGGLKKGADGLPMFLKNDLLTIIKLAEEQIEKEKQDATSA